MLDLEQLQILAQLIDNSEASIIKLEKAYDKNNAEDFTNSKNEIIDIQKKIAGSLKK
jgi:hypothetical protein